MATPILTALYLRASTDEQTESIPAQQMLLEQYAKDHNFKIVAIYQDKGKSGDSFQRRAGLQQMLADAKAGKFQQVLVRNLSRLSRRNSLKTAAQIITPLLDAGVGVCTANQGDLKLDTATGRIVLTVLAEMENSENSSRAFNVLNGLLQAAAAGYWVSPSPWGYKVVGEKCRKELQLGDPHTVDTIRRIFRLYASGQPLRAIARQLNSEGIGSPAGGNWCGQTIRQVLVRPVYCGDHVYNLRSKGKYYQLQAGTLAERKQHWRADGETANSQWNDQADWIYITDRWPAIVDRATWEAAQALLQKNQKNTAPSREYLFSSLLRCQCGGSMQGRKQKTSSKRYACVKCGATACEAELLEHVTTAIQRQYSPEHISKLRQAMQRKLSSNQRSNGAAIKPIQSKLQRYEKRLLEVDSDMLPVVQAEIRSLRQQLQEAERSQRAASHACQDTDKRIDQALADFFSLPKAIKRKPPAEVRRYFQQTIERIEVQTAIKQGKSRKRYSLAALDIFGSVKPVLSQPPWNPSLAL